MKNLLIIAILYISILSCSKSDEIQTESQSKISQVLSEKNEISQKIMYGLLSKEDKFQLWQGKIEKIINSNHLTKAQTMLMNELQDKFTPSLFDDTKMNDEKQIFKTVFVPTFLKKASLIFDDEFIYNNFFTISSRNIVHDIYPIEVLPGAPPCSCNVGSIWSCGLGSVTCTSTNKCTTTMSGCGFATFFECNGNCYIY